MLPPYVASLPRKWLVGMALSTAFAIAAPAMSDEPTSQDRKANRATVSSASSRPVCTLPTRPVSNRTERPDFQLISAKLSASDPSEAPVAWWQDQVSQPMATDGTETTSLPITLESLLIRTLDHASQIRVFGDLPLIRETAIVEADAAFDWSAFAETRWDDLNDPVGSTLTGVPLDGRYRNRSENTALGLRKRLVTGGKLEAAQKLGVQTTNSVYFLPHNQGTARLSLNYTQPLLRGNGRLYNQSLVCLAQIDTRIAEVEFQRQVQSHLLEVARAYWGLHLERANVLQKHRALERVQAVEKQLQARAGIDAVVPQLKRAESEAAARYADLLRAKTGVKNAEAKLRALVNDPSLGTHRTTELLPLDPLIDTAPQVNVAQSLANALVYRPEVAQSLQQIRAGCIRLRMSKHELLPVLNAFTEAYVAGLQGGHDVPEAFGDQFSRGAPGYAVGLQAETNLGNRAALARHDRRTLEFRQLQNQYETTVKTLKLEVSVALREVTTSHSEMLAQKQAVRASAAQWETLSRRWELLPGDDGNGALVLENMLRAQERLMRAESAYTTAWVSYNLSQLMIKKATGELLQSENITWGDYCDEVEGIKTRTLHKSAYADNCCPTSPSLLPVEALSPEPVPPSAELSPIPEGVPPAPAP